MKKLVLFLVAAFAIGLQAVADSGGVLIDFHRKSKSKNDTPPHRAPMYLPIDVYYDDTTRQFEVVCDGEQTHRYTSAMKTVQPSTTLPASTPH